MVRLLGGRDHVLLDETQVLVVGGCVAVDDVAEAPEEAVVAPLIGEEGAHDLPDPGLLDPDVLEDVLMAPHGGAHVHVESDRGDPCLNINESRAEGRVLPAVMEYCLQESGDEAVARLFDGGPEPFHVFQLQVPLFLEHLDQFWQGLTNVWAGLKPVSVGFRKVF